MTDPNLNPSLVQQINQQQYGMYGDTYHQMYAQMSDRNEIIPPPTSTVPHNNELTQNGVCKRFIHGKCKLGSDCPHPHDKSKIKACDKMQRTKQCPYGEKCNFSHDLNICRKFQKNQCTKGIHCPFRHVYKACPNFDMGYCPLQDCEFKHITRKLCWDYTYGYCQKGNKCSDHHPKIFIQEDFKNTRILYSLLSKAPLEIIICKNCKIIGHKVNRCPKRQEIEPKQAFKCGLCGAVHLIMDDCNFLH